MGKEQILKAVGSLSFDQLETVVQRETGLIVQVFSPEHPGTLAERRTAMELFYQHLEPNGLLPHEVKLLEHFQYEMEHCQDRKILILLRTVEGKLVGAIYAPVFESMGRIRSAIEYIFVVEEYRRSGYGTLLFHIARKVVQWLAVSRKMLYGGFFVEAVTAVTEFWHAIDAHLICKTNDPADNIVYKMTRIVRDMEMGTSPDALAGNRVRVIDISSLTVGEYVQLLRDFHHAIYRMERDQFPNRAAYIAAVRLVEEVLAIQEVMNFWEVADMQSLHLLHTAYPRG